MKKANTILISLIFGLLVSITISILILSILSVSIGSSTDKWLYYVLLIPTMIVFGFLGSYFHNKELDNLKNIEIWKISLISVLSIGLTSSIIGGIISDVIKIGNLQAINYKGRILWGFIYSITSLPITIIIGKLIIIIFIRLIKSIKSATPTKK
ncbi:hypothetical protein [Metasolibacillus sp. FSL K6-0083]|uniref:hypothetical protein n=1 Tax=Metasolibacillus sp. FSL K6-0083 TaxID=2921416 RepID=UPI003159FF75